MNEEKNKFEQSRERFRRNIEAQQAKIRRTIFLHDDEMPTTSRRAQERERNQSNPRVRGQRSKRPVPTTSTQRTKPARHFRTAVDPPTRQSTCKSGTPTVANDVITISDDDEIEPLPFPATAANSEPLNDDEVAPPPPPYTIITPTPDDQAEVNLEDERSELQTPLSLSGGDDCETVDDLDINLEDLNDPIIEEFYRSFLGENDTTVDIRPLTPPSPEPLSSSSSLDWENENFRPPTPPKRRGFGELEVIDRQYQYLGMQCYERACRVRILVPRKSTTQALAVGAPPTRAPPNACQLPEDDTAWQFGSPPRQHPNSVPTTPGSGWLEKSITNHDMAEPTATLSNSPARLPGTINPNNPK